MIGGLIDRAVDMFASRPSTAAKINQDIFMMPEFEIGKGAKKLFSYKQFGMEGYRKNVCIFAGIVSIATSLAQLKFKLYDRKAKSGTLEEINDPDHELLALLNDPVNSVDNPEITGYEFQEFWWTDYEVGGNVVCLISRSASGKPARLDLLRPDWVTPIIEKDGTVKTYEYQVDGFGKKTQFEARDIIHLKNHPDTENRWWGLSSIAVMVRQAELDERIADFMLSLMLNQGIPGMILRHKEINWSPEAKEDIRHQIANRVGGKNVGNALILDPGWEMVTGVTQTNREMQTNQFITYAEQRILAALGVPPVIIGVAAGVLNMTYDNFEHAKRLWWEDKLIPKSTKGLEKFQQLAENFDENLVLAYDYSPIKALREKISDEEKHFLEMYKVNAIDRNELRKKSNFLPIDADKKPVYYQDTIAIASAAPPVNGEVIDDDDAEGGRAMPKKFVQAIVNGLGLGPERLALPDRVTGQYTSVSWKTLRAIANSATPALRRELLRSLKSLQSGVDLSAMEAALTRGDVNAAVEAVPWDEFQANLVKKATDTFLKIIVRAATKSAGAIPGDFSFNKSNPLAIDWARANAAQLVTNVSNVTREAIRNAIVRALEMQTDWKRAAKDIRSLVGLTDPQIKALEKLKGILEQKGYSDVQIEQRLGARIQRMIRYRSDMIARTESIDAANRGQELAWESAMEEGWLDPRTVERQWIAGPEACPLCVEMARSKPVGLAASWPGGVVGPPLHPNCGCTEGLVFKK